MFKKFKCHKVVEAGQITAIREDGVIEIYQNEDEPLQLGQAWVERHHPEVGGYVVVYNDGYCSYSPQAAFEEGYSEIAEGETAQ